MLKEEPGSKTAVYLQRRRLQDMVHIQLPVRGQIPTDYRHRGGKITSQQSKETGGGGLLKNL